MPFVAVILRRGYGLGAQAMVAGSLHEPLADEGEREERIRELTALAKENAEALKAATLFEFDDAIDPA